MYKIATTVAFVLGLLAGCSTTPSAPAVTDTLLSKTSRHRDDHG